MSVGTPILATNVGGVKEFFNTDCGKFINQGEIEEIKNSLMNFCDYKKDWDDKAQTAKARMEKYFNAEIMGDNYMKHLSLKLTEAK